MKTQDFTGSRERLSKRGRASAARPLASIVLDCKAAAGRWGRGRADVLQSAAVRPPKLSSGAAPGRNRRAINSGLEINSVLRRLLVCALSALFIAAAAVPLAAAPAAAQEKK